MSDSPLTTLGLNQSQIRLIDTETVKLLVWARYLGPTGTAATQAGFHLHKWGLGLSRDQILNLGEYFTNLFGILDPERPNCYFCNLPYRDGICNCYLDVVEGDHYPHISIEGIEWLRRDMPATWGNQRLKTGVCPACYHFIPGPAHQILAKLRKLKQQEGNKQSKYHGSGVPPWVHVLSKYCRACNQARLEAREQAGEVRQPISAPPPAIETTLEDALDQNTIKAVQQKVAEATATIES